ncbi:MAG TPA: RidA family protein [Polyangiaceae bacterium]|nr:RidA family protein [Polyangiaceae bacterium]
MPKSAVVTADAPAAIGPYSQAIVSGDLIFTSGQIPLDARGNLVGGEIEDQVRQVMENLKAVLHKAGANFDSVVKTTIYLRSLADFSRVNAVYESYFGQCPPARSTVQVAALPRDASVEIDMIARR